ncbi:cytokine receptor common subunit beta isoform X1 [Elgaria multicarinata webbii]|uniref:cytokine receptor common subunit beta isoform X1 n=1 Tax=Elgaria multicarinata webbii TaxID=159646 RepID=UPI002FCCC92E
MMCNSEKGDSRIHWSCSMNQTDFYVFLNNYFIFKPELELEVKLNVSLFDNFQPPPPQKLGIDVTKDGNFLLAWEAGDGMNRSHWLDGALNFHITYKRDWEPWKKSSSLWVTNTSHCLLQRGKLMPGSTYVARVRSKLKQGSDLVGHYSSWSSAVTWKTSEDSKVEAQPKNLHCRFNGIDQLKCSWEVRQEVTSSVLFTLFYKENSGSIEKECSPVYVENVTLTPHHILQSCKINVSNPNRQSQYCITVRPKEEEQVMKPTLHIKPDPPYNLSLKVLNNQDYRLQWEARVINKALNIPKKYEILYWKTGTPGVTQRVEDNNGDQHFTFTSQFLEPSTHYTAKVRAKVNKEGRDGPWSEWSKEFEWATERVPACIIFMMAGIWSCHECLLSKKRRWEATIPSPPRMLLLPEFFQKIQLPDGSEVHSSHSSLEEGIGYANIFESQMLVSHLESLRPGSEKIKPHTVASQDTEKTEVPCAAEAGHFLTQAMAGDQPVHNAHTQIFDYDGPYIHCGPESSLADVQQKLDVAPLEMKETSVLLQYVGLPHSLLSQQVLVGTKKGMAPSFSIVKELVREEKQQLLPKRQEASQSQLGNGKLEEEGNRPQNLSRTNRPDQTGPLDYIDIEDLSISKGRGSLVLLPVVASKESAATDAAELPGTTEDLSYQKKPETIFPAKEQSLATPSAPSQKAFDDYVLSLPGMLGSVPKEGVPFSMEEPKQDKSFLIFKPDDKSPIFLCQVGDYCFFPGSKDIKEAAKSPEGSAGGKLPETSQKVKEPLSESKLQATPQPCQDWRVPVPQ